MKWDVGFEVNEKRGLGRVSLTVQRLYIAHRKATQTAITLKSVDVSDIIYGHKGGHLGVNGNPAKNFRGWVCVVPAIQIIKC